MGVMVPNAWGKALEPGVNAWFGKAYAEYPEEWKHLFEVHKSKKHFEEDVGINGFGLMVKRPIGGNVSYDTASQGMVARYKHAEYALGFVISKILVDDNLYMEAAMRDASSLAFSARQTKEFVCATVYNRATNSSYTGADGVSLLNTAHLRGKGGTYANKPTVDVDLSEAALDDALIAIAKMKNDAGLTIALKAISLHVPPELMFVAERLLKSEGRVGTANNDINALLSTGQFPKGVHVNHYFTDTDAWFIRTNAPHGMKFFERQAPQLGMINDFDTDNAKFKLSERYSAGWSDPRGIYGSTGG